MTAELIGQILGFTVTGFALAALVLWIYGKLIGKKVVTWKRVIIGGIIVMLLSLLGKVVPK